MKNTYPSMPCNGMLLLSIVFFFNVLTIFGQTTQEPRPNNWCSAIDVSRTTIPEGPVDRIPTCDNCIGLTESCYHPTALNGAEDCDFDLPTCTWRLPMQYHVLTSGGTYPGNASIDATIDAEMAAINDVYSQIGAEFFVCSPTNFIADPNGGDGIWTSSTDDDLQGGNITNANDVPGVINVYLVDGFSNGICGYAYLPTTNVNVGLNHMVYSYQNAGCGFGTGSTSIHEIGHFLGLYHTHTDDDPATPIDEFTDVASQENPAGGGASDANVYCADCNVASPVGDCIFDTEPDPMLQGGDCSGCCPCPGNCYVDPCGGGCGYVGPAGYNPQLDNFMSYTPFGPNQCGGGQFTQCQLAKMNDELNYCKGTTLDGCMPDPVDIADMASVCNNAPIANLTTTTTGTPFMAECFAWWDVAAGGMPIQEGANFTPPIPTQPDGCFTPGTYTFWVSNANIFECTTVESNRQEFSITIVNCGACSVVPPCDAMAGEPNTAEATACAAGTGPGMAGELDASAVDLSTIFSPATGTDVVTNYVVFDQATGEFVGASANAITDLAALGCSGTVCIKQVAYSQATLDVITEAVDGVLTPFGFAPLTPIDLAGFLTFLNDLFGPYTEVSLNNLLTNGLSVNLFGVIPINIPFPDFCYDFSDAEVCITVVNCAPPCDFNTCNAIDVVICGLNWDISGNDQYTAVGTEGTNLNTEIGFTIEATDPAGNLIMGSAFYNDGFEMGTVNPGIILAGLQNSCPGAADALINIEICFWEDDSFVVDPFSFNVGEQPNMEYDDCGDPDNEFFIPPFGPTLMFPDDPFGGPECGTACEMFVLDLNAAGGAGFFAGTNYNADYIFTCVPQACDCPTEVIVADATSDICDGGLTTQIADWQAAINTANPLDLALMDPDPDPTDQDICGFGSIIYSSVPDGDPSFPDGILPDGVHSDIDPCVNETQTVFAYLQCDAPDAALEIVTEYALISRLDLTIWPAIQAIVVDNDGGCGPAINTVPCATYVVTNDYDANGAIPDFSAEAGIGALTFTITNPGAPTDCLSLAVPATFNCELAPPIPAFDCPGTMVDKCAGAVSLNAVDNEPETAATSVGTWSGSGAGYIVANGAGIGDDEFDPTNAPVGIPLTLVLTLIDAGQSVSTVECIITIVKNCAADGGRF